MQTVQQQLAAEAERQGIAAFIPEAMRQMAFPIGSLLTWQQQQLVQWIAAVLYSNQTKQEQS